MGGLDSSNSILASVECYSPPTDTWALKAPLLGVRSHHAVVAMEDHSLYALGGYNGSTLKTCERYSLSENTWAPVASMSVARYGLAAASLGGMIYAVGGEGGTRKEVERYSPSEDKWERVADLGTGRYGLGAAVVNNRLYAVGGWEGRKVVEVYNSEENTWAREGDMSTARAYLAVVAV